MACLQFDRNLWKRQPKSGLLSATAGVDGCWVGSREAGGHRDKPTPASLCGQLHRDDKRVTKLDPCDQSGEVAAIVGDSGDSGDSSAENTVRA